MPTALNPLKINDADATIAEELRAALTVIAAELTSLLDAPAPTATSLVDTITSDPVALLALKDALAD